MPIHRYLLSLRLALALDRLLDRSVGLSAIAYSLGFSSHSHFTTLFRRAFGLSPSELGPAHRGAPAVTLRKNLPA